MGEGEPQGPADIATLIVRMATQRDRAAFAALFQLCAPKLMYYMVTRANGILPLPVLEEVCQETLVAAWHNCASFDPKRDEPVAWLFVIARNLCIKELHEQLELGDAVGVLQNGTPKPLPLDDSLEASDRMERLRKALDMLPPEEVTLLRDIYLHGKTHSEIARTRRLPLGTVKAQIRRVIDRMRKTVMNGEAEK